MGRAAPLAVIEESKIPVHLPISIVSCSPGQVYRAMISAGTAPLAAQHQTFRGNPAQPSLDQASSLAYSASSDAQELSDNFGYQNRRHRNASPPPCKAKFDAGS